MFDGWKAYREKGLKLPAEVREETERYRDASDVCKDFLVDRVVSGGGSIGSTRLYQAFKSWFGETHNQRQQPMSQKMSQPDLISWGITLKRREMVTFFVELVAYLATRSQNKVCSECGACGGSELIP